MDLPMLDGFGCGNGINPMDIPHIVDNVMRYIPRGGRELQTCRLVCKQWAASATPVLKTRIELRVGRYNTNITKFAELIEVAGTSNNFPIRIFTFCQDIFQSENEDVLANFFRILSPTVEIITLWFDLKSTFAFNKDCFISSPEFQDIKLPRLRSLGLDDRRPINDTFYESGPIFIRWLLQSSPNLEELIIQYDREFELNGQEKGGHVGYMLYSLLHENRTSLRHLKDLKLDVHVNDTLLNHLTELCQTSKLTSLRLCLRKSSFHHKSFRALLSTLTHSLKELRLTFLAPDSDFNIHFPRMENLSLLEISGWDLVAKKEYFGNFSYETHFPRLKSLNLNSCTGKWNWSQFLNCGGNPVLCLEELKLPKEVTLRQNMRKIVTLFPNLKRLELCVTIEEIRVLDYVFAFWTELTHLKLTRSPHRWTTALERIDYIFTGINEEECEKIRRSNCLEELFPVITEDLQSLKKAPGLTNLKKLRSLELKELQYLAQITDVTGYLGFMNMKSLEYLDVGRSGMSQDCMKKLAKKFPQNMAVQVKSPKGSRKTNSTDDDYDDGPLELPGCVYL